MSSFATSLKESKSYLLAICLLAYVLALAAAVLVFGSLDGGIILRLLLADVAATLVIFAIGTALKNSSVYDPYWSLAPPALLAGFAFQGVGTIDSSRGFVVALLVAFWAWRLTWNCMRRWPNLTHEDFRYIDKRAQTGKFYPLVDLFGIQGFPTLLVFWGAFLFTPSLLSAAAHGIGLIHSLS